MDNSLVVVPSGGRVRSFVFVFVFVHTMTTALDDDDGTRRRRRDGGQLGEVRAGRVDARERVGRGTGRTSAGDESTRRHPSSVIIVRGFNDYVDVA